ncbi:hypothetical protein G7K_3040-t1 [Saitoella complicata NRRL Y-17804]|uniref:Uncharacterized protein n=1 Tax=Saitoella complicata (strain BCRC 22490 / CBS 7301 / JCM 7358 / NBRC 10748 / NRRL Y-17804) TaxID=698492 RepID=A0A0E9NGT3_SAICN|nr:hypothetical protein G7K_3040-t1 [Saitoella complicata NRRL Y-17804]
MAEATWLEGRGVLGLRASAGLAVHLELEGLVGSFASHSRSAVICQASGLCRDLISMEDMWLSAGSPWGSHTDQRPLTEEKGWPMDPV